MDTEGARSHAFAHPRMREGSQWHARQPTLGPRQQRKPLGRGERVSFYPMRTPPPGRVQDKPAGDSKGE